MGWHRIKNTLGDESKAPTQMDPTHAISKDVIFKMNENYKMVSQGIGQKLVYPQIQRDLPNHWHYSDMWNSPV